VAGTRDSLSRLIVIVRGEGLGLGPMKSMRFRVISPLPTAAQQATSRALGGRPRPLRRRSRLRLRRRSHVAVAPAALGTRRLSGSRIQNGRAVHLLVSLPPEYGFNPSEVRVASSSFHRLARMRGASKIRNENFADFSGADSMCSLVDLNALVCKFNTRLGSRTNVCYMALCKI